MRMGEAADLKRTERGGVVAPARYRVRVGEFRNFVIAVDKARGKYENLRAQYENLRTQKGGE